MAFFNLPFGIRVAGSDPADGDRYLVADAATRDLLIDNGRAYEGVQCYQEDTKILYILKDVATRTWEVVGGSGSGDKSYTHIQPTAAIVWNVTHNLGKIPAVSVYSMGLELVEAQIDYIDINNLTITFNNSYSGSVTLN